MDRIEAMGLLREVVDQGSFSAAGRTLRVPVATLSRKISDLEAHLGARLLVRTTRKLSLTDAGAAYIAAARRILDQVDEAEREAAGEFEAPKGALVVTAPLQFGRVHVLPLVTEFLALFPAITARLVLTDHTLDLVDAHVDLAVRIGRLEDSSMVATRVGAMRTVVCMSPDLLGRHGIPASPEDLKRVPIVAAERSPAATLWRFRHAGSDLDVPLAPRLTVTTTEAAAQAAVGSTGAVQLLRYQVEDEVRAGTLRIVLDAYEPEPLPIHLLHAERGQLPLKMRRFLDFAATRLRAAMSGRGPVETAPPWDGAGPRSRVMPPDMP